MKRLVLLLALLFAVPLAAQDRPIAGTTLQSTDTSANSLLVGCAIGSTSCTGGIKGGALVIGGGTSITSTSNIALLNAANTFTSTGTQAFAGALNVNTSGTVTSSFADGVKIAGWDALGYDGTSTLTIGGYRSSTWTAIKWYTNGSLRFGISVNGDLLKGSNIMDSVGTPVIAANFGTSPSIAGNDYAFLITLGSGAGNTGGSITFGRTWTNAPVCSATSSAPALSLATSTTALTIGYTNGTYTGVVIHVLCRGY